MNDIFDFTRQSQVQKDEMELIEKQRHEFKFVRSERKVPGHTMFSYNINTGEIKVAPVEHCKDIDFMTLQPLFRDKIVIEKDCVYRQALNKKNFVKRLIREGIIAKKNEYKM